MSIARSLRKAGHLKPMSDSLMNLLASVDKDRKEEQKQADILSLVSQMKNVGTQVPMPPSLGATGAEEQTFMSPDEQYGAKLNLLNEFNLGQGNIPSYMRGLLGQKPEEKKDIDTFEFEGSVYTRTPTGIELVKEGKGKTPKDKIKDRYTNEKGERVIAYESGKQEILGKTSSSGKVEKAKDIKISKDLEEELKSYKDYIGQTPESIEEVGQTDVYYGDETLEQFGIGSENKLKTLRTNYDNEISKHGFTSKIDTFKKAIKSGGVTLKQVLEAIDKSEGKYKKNEKELIMNRIRLGF